MDLLKEWTRKEHVETRSEKGREDMLRCDACCGLWRVGSVGLLRMEVVRLEIEVMVMKLEVCVEKQKPTSEQYRFY